MQGGVRTCAAKLESAQMRDRYVKRFLQDVPVECQKLAQQRIGIVEWIAIAVCGHGAGERFDAMQSKQPVGAQHVVTVADERRARPAAFSHYLAAE